MYVIYGNIYHINIPQISPNVSIYTIHGSYGSGVDIISGLQPQLLNTYDPRIPGDPLRQSSLLPSINLLLQTAQAIRLASRRPGAENMGESPAFIGKYWWFFTAARGKYWKLNDAIRWVVPNSGWLQFLDINVVIMGWQINAQRPCLFLHHTNICQIMRVSAPVSEPQAQPRMPCRNWPKNPTKNASIRGQEVNWSAQRRFSGSENPKGEPNLTKLTATKRWYCDFICVAELL